MKQETKQNLKNHLRKAERKKRVFILGDSILKHVNSYEITKKLDNCKVYAKIFSGEKIKCMEDQSRPYSYLPWYKRSFIKERVSRNFQRHRVLNFETEIRHLSGFSFKSNNTK